MFTKNIRFIYQSKYTFDESFCFYNSSRNIYGHKHFRKIEILTF